MNFREAWAEGEIEAGALLDEIDRLRAELAAERERCAKLCEEEHVGRDMYDEELDDSDLAYNNAVRDCAAAIRKA